ncbi:MAG: signal peptidase II [Planctomycetes bacterium]|jgi:lipoprotein signal peptidase|nr:signal peptidase II [Planctomycetota bacterium]
MNVVPHRSYFVLFAVLAIGGLAADQASKYLVFSQLYPGEATEIETRQVVIPGLFDLRTLYTRQYDAGEGRLSFLRTISGDRLPYVNRGALFGIGGGDDDEAGGMNGFFAIVSVLAAIFIVGWVTRAHVAQDRFLCLALGLILGGTLGNLYDRIVFHGVRDFLHWYYETHVWPDFNIADCCLVCGAGTLLLHSFFVKDPAPDAAKVEPAPAQAPLETTSSTPGA